MDNFVFCAPTKFVFGRGAENEAGKYLKQYGATKVLLHYGGGSVKRSGLFDRVVASIEAEGIGHVELGGVQPNPRLSLVRQGMELCRKEGVDFILAIGGGSVIDSSKAISMGLKYDGDVWDFFCGKRQPVDRVPVATILTLPAAGSEGSISCVITNDEGVKRGANNDVIRPVFSLMNPELCATLPKNQVANGVADIMAHSMERYFTNTPHGELIDNMLEALLKTMVDKAPIAVGDPADYDAQSQIMWAGMLSHNNSLGVGRTQDWASHMIEHELSGMFDIAHGAGLAIIFPAWMKYVYKHDVARFARFANRVFGIEIDVFDMDMTARRGIAALESFFDSLGLPTRLSQLNIHEDSIDELARLVKKANPDGTCGGFVHLDTAACREILRIAL